MMPMIGRGARGPAVVGSSSELPHHWHPWATPTQDFIGAGRRRDHARKRAHCFKHLVGHLRAARVHEQHAILPDRSDDIAAGAAEEIDVPADGQDPDVTRGRFRLRANVVCADP